MEISKEKILKILDTPWQESAELARQNQLAAAGSHVFVRGLIEFSNICRRNCRYCGLRAQNGNVHRYRLTQEQILDAARQAAACGVDTIVLQSGEGACEAEWLAEIVHVITRELRLPVTLSVGECGVADYEMWRKAGASRYLLKHETADAVLYRELHPGYNLQERLDCLQTLRSVGYEIGSGFMVGLPGQSLASLASDILLCRSLHVDMCGAGPFIPQSHTPLADAAPGSAELTLRVLAALRLALPWANLPATTALATLEKVNGQTNGLLAGANVLMPSFTPSAQAADYAIYDSKNRVSAENAAKAITDAGRTHTLRVNNC